METKSLSQVRVKSGDKGEVTAVFATFNVIDKEGDVTLPGAFEEGAEVAISAYDHKSWKGSMPVGSGRIRTTDVEAVLDGQFFMDTNHGRDAFYTVKGMGSRQEWSYGYRTLHEPIVGDFHGKRANFLKRLAVEEVSPVWRGAGINTRTLAVKSADEGAVIMPSEFKAAIRPHDTKVVTSTWDASTVLKAIPDDASVSALRSVFAWVDSNADPETKSAYKFPHHSSVGGPANVRACLAGVAALNGARGGSSIPEADRKGVYNHLASHLRDADREPPELRSSSEGAGLKSDGLKFSDELTVVLCDLSNLIDRASEVVALRVKKGRSPLSAGSEELLSWLDEDLKRLRVLLTSTEELGLHERARFLRMHLLGE